MIKLRLPWPPSILSPNARSHWAAKSIARKKYKNDCRMMAGRVVALEDRIHLRLTFHPPDKRKRDMDNLLASCKALLDGIAQAWKVDDARFRLTLDIGAPVKYGAVVVEL